MLVLVALILAITCAVPTPPPFVTGPRIIWSILFKDKQLHIVLEVELQSRNLIAT